MDSEIITLPSTRYLAISPNQTFALTARTVTELIEVCLSEGVSRVLAREQHVPCEFFQLQTLEAGEILQKLRTYDIRLAIVVLKEQHYSKRFQEMVTEQSRRGYFRIFADKQKAEEWFREIA